MLRLLSAIPAVCAALLLSLSPFGLSQAHAGFRTETRNGQVVYRGTNVPAKTGADRRSESAAPPRPDRRDDSGYPRSRSSDRLADRDRPDQRSYREHPAIRDDRGGYRSASYGRPQHRSDDPYRYRNDRIYRADRPAPYPAARYHPRYDVGRDGPPAPRLASRFGHYPPVRPAPDYAFRGAPPMNGPPDEPPLPPGCGCGG